MYVHHKVIEKFKNDNDAPTMDTTHNPIAVKYIRFDVKTCLYLSPNNRARSLSMLIAVTVNKVTVHKI